MEKKFSVKEFFKSTAFKCIYVLLAIVLVCGVLLAFCNDLFEVTAEEKLNRTLSKIYGQSVEAEDALKDGMTLEFDNGEINSAYLVKDDGNYLVNASGTGGYYGSVACWIVVEISDNSLSGIRSVIVDKADNASEFTNRISEDNLEYFADSFDGEEEFTVSDWQGDSLHGGATPQLTMTAIVNAVNTALEFVRTQLLGEVVGPDPFEGFSYTDYIDTAATTVEIAEDNESVIFHITTGTIYSAASKVDITVNSEGVITDYTIVSEGTTPGMGLEEGIKDVTAYENKTAADLIPLLGTKGEDGFTWENADESLVTGATMTNFTYVYAAVFAASNYQNGYVMALENSVEYTQYIDMENTMVSVADGTVTYNVVTTSYGQAQAFNITIIVNADGTIADFTITHNGSTDDTFKGYMNEDILSGAMFETKNAAAILDMFKEPTGENGEFVKNDLEDSSLASGATDSTYNNAGYSNFLCVYSALFAASNYEVYTELAQYLPPAFTYTDYIDVDNTTWDIADDESSVTFHIVTKDYSPAKAFNIDITVNADGTIADFTITKNGSTDATFEGYMNDDILSGEMFETKNAAAILDMFKEPTGEDGEFVKNDLEDSSLASGATDSTYNNAGYSNFLCVYSALFAAENYDLLISRGENA